MGYTWVAEIGSNIRVAIRGRWLALPDEAQQEQKG